jgi:hypothetical protein
MVTAHALQRLVVEIGDARVDLEIVQRALNGDRAQRPHLHVDAGMPRTKRRDQMRQRRQRGRNAGEPERAEQGVVTEGQILLEALIVGDDLPGPGQHALAFGGQPEEAVAANDQRHAKLFLQLAQAR